LFQLTMVIVYAIAILGLAILVGFNGQISLGHGAFYAIGAYTTAVLMYKYEVPYWATLPASAVVCAGFGFLIGLPALRLAGLYLALTTFALAVAVPQLLKHDALEPWTGGVQGLVIDKPDPPFGLDMSPDQWLYVFSLTVAALLFLLAWNIVRGRIGRAMMAIRDHALAAEAMGIDIALLKTRTFALSALFTGVAGSLGAIVVQFVAPDSFNIFVSIYLFVGLVVGGVSSIGGAILGGFFIEFVPNVAEKVSKAAPGAVYGVILPYSRKHELEADAVGVGLMRAAGHDPRGALSFWERRIAEADARQPPEFLSTHPADRTRLSALRAAVGAG